MIIHFRKNFTCAFLSGVEGFATEADSEMVARLEKLLKQRFAIGTQVSQQTIVQNFIQQQYPEQAILTVIYSMLRRGQLQHSMQRKLLLRIS